MSDEKRRGGRPKLGKIRKLSFRVAPDLERKLVSEAGRLTRSISEVIEARLERSFDREALLNEVTAAVARGAVHRLLVQEYGEYSAPIEFRLTQ